MAQKIKFSNLGPTRSEIEKAITDRLEARKNKDWAKSDEIRDLLTAKRIVLKILLLMGLNGLLIL